VRLPVPGAAAALTLGPTALAFVLASLLRVAPAARQLARDLAPPAATPFALAKGESGAVRAKRGVNTVATLATLAASVAPGRNGAGTHDHPNGASAKAGR
jgi:hypothetical protein